MTPHAFHPTLARWFTETLGEPTRPQREAWPLVRAGGHVLIAAPTGTGKTLAAFLSALDGLLREGDALPDETRVLYVSPLRALSNDVRKNLLSPLAELRERDPGLPEVRVVTRTGDTPQKERAAMVKRAPHVLVTTPESLYILLTSASGRATLRTVRTVIVDEIHAMAGTKRGSHLALSLERLDRLAGAPQRIGLSATQRPLETTARLLVGGQRECALVDAGHLRELDLDVVMPDAPLSSVCSHEQWDEVYREIAKLVRAHKSTLVFVNTRKHAEQLSARLGDELGKDAVGCHHGSLSRERRLEAEARLKAGSLAVLVATASLELGIDIGDVDLVVQIGAARSIATLLQRVGRAGHGVDRRPKGRVVPLTRDEAVETVALLRALRAGLLDRTPDAPCALDVLAQQAVAACVGEEDEHGILTDELYESFRRAGPYAELSREDFDQALDLHTGERLSMLHRDAIGGRIRATKRARLPALTSGGAIPDNANYRVLLQPGDAFVGTVDEDFAVEASKGDIFQLGNSSWRILRVEPGVVRVADAEGAPPSLPFWFGEAPARTKDLMVEISRVREECTGAAWVEAECGVGGEFAAQVAEYLAQGAEELGAMPTRHRLIAERFFDESGGMQLVIHAPLGARINRALGLALRKRICRGFGFELQAAADEEAIVLSLGPQHSFQLDEVFDWLRPANGREVVEQALLAAPVFPTRWRWSAQFALLLPRFQGGRRVAPPIQRMRADDLLARAFPQVVACGENLPPGDLPIPREHPLVRQTIEDCLTDWMDVDGFIEVLEGLRDGSIERRAIDSASPSVFAASILNARPYAFLDDAPLEERRTQAVMSRRTLDVQTVDDLGALDPAVIARVREEAWPQARNAEEVHEALLWMGFLADGEAETWNAWLVELEAAGRVAHEDGRWFATEASRAPLELLRGRLEALGPVAADDPLIVSNAAEILALEQEGHVLRTRFEGRDGWCVRRLLARIQRYTLEGLRRAIQPVSVEHYLRFLSVWQHVDEPARLHGPRGVMAVVEQLAGFQAPAEVWERWILPSRVEGYRPEWLDELAMAGELVWGRLWRSSNVPARSLPVSFLPRAERREWLALSEPVDVEDLRSDARAVQELLASEGASFFSDLQSGARVLPSRLEEILIELAGRGLATCDGFAGLRHLFKRPRSHHARRRRAQQPAPPVGRWSTFRPPGDARTEEHDEDQAEWVARRLLARYGVLAHQLLAREAIPIPWRRLAHACRRLELRGEVHGGRFVNSVYGEQFALPEAVRLLRKLRDALPVTELRVATADPVNLVGILTPEPRVSSGERRTVVVLPATEPKAPLAE